MSKDKFVGEAGDFGFPWIRPEGDDEAARGAMVELGDRLARKEITPEQYEAAVKALAGPAAGGQP